EPAIPCSSDETSASERSRQIELSAAPGRLKNSGSRSVAGRARQEGIGRLAPRGGVLDDLFEHREVSYVAPLSLGGEAAPGLRPGVLVVLGDRDQVFGGQQLQMAAQ